MGRSQVLFKETIYKITIEDIEKKKLCVPCLNDGSGNYILYHDLLEVCRNDPMMNPGVLLMTPKAAFFNSKDLIHQKFVSSSKTINTEFYKGTLDRLLKKLPMFSHLSELSRIQKLVSIY